MGSDQLYKKKKAKSEAMLARKKAKKSPYKTMAIICEDTKSAVYYFKELIRHFRLNTANVIVMPSKGSAPISVVEHGVEYAKNNPDIDYIACVFDHDNHESYNRALKKIETLNNPLDKKVTFLAITSTPCYELWVLLHFSYTTKSYTTNSKSAAKNLINELLNYLPSYRKNITDWFHITIQRLDKAIKNAKRLEKYNTETNSQNPATNMHALVELLLEFKNY